MISPTMPGSPCTDTKIIPDFASVSSDIRTVIFQLLLDVFQMKLKFIRYLIIVITH